MSYILDALQKSERERQRQKIVVPTLPLDDGPAQAPKRVTYLVYIAIASGLLSVGVLIGWLQTSRGPSAAPVAAPQVEVTQMPPVVATAPAAQMAPVPAQTVQPASVEQPPLQTVVVPPPVVLPSVTLNAAAAAKPTATNAPVAAGSLQVAQSSMPTSAAPATSVNSLPKAAGNAALDTGKSVDTGVAVGEVGLLADLPLNVQQEIPAMNVLFHTYSATPSQRMVDVNNKPLHEGDFLSPGLKLDAITKDGMVFSYKGYRFKASVR